MEGTGFCFFRGVFKLFLFGWVFFFVCVVFVWLGLFVRLVFLFVYSHCYKVTPTLLVYVRNPQWALNVYDTTIIIV